MKLWAPLSSRNPHTWSGVYEGFFNPAFKHFPVHNPGSIEFARASKCCWQLFLHWDKTSYPGEAKAESFLTPNNIHWCGHLVSHGNPVLALFVLLSTLINQGVGRFYFKLQKMFILSRAMTISYMAYPSFQRKERILRNSPGKLIFKAVGGRGEKKTKHHQSHRHTKPQRTLWWHRDRASRLQPLSLLLPSGTGRISLGQEWLQDTSPERNGMAAPTSKSTKQSRRN